MQLFLLFVENTVSPRVPNKVVLFHSVSNEMSPCFLASIFSNVVTFHIPFQDILGLLL